MAAPKRRMPWIWWSRFRSPIGAEGRFHHLPPVVIEADADHDLAELGLCADSGALAVKVGPLPSHGDVPVVSDGVVDHPALGDPASVVGDRDGELRDVMGEVVGAVQGVDDPEVFGGGVAGVGLFGEDLVAGVGPADDLDDGAFGLKVGVGDEVGDVLGAHGGPLAEVPRDDRPGGSGRLLGDAQLGPVHRVGPFGVLGSVGADGRRGHCTERRGRGAGVGAGERIGIGQRAKDEGQREGGRRKEEKRRRKKEGGRRGTTGLEVRGKEACMGETSKSVRQGLPCSVLCPPPSALRPRPLFLFPPSPFAYPVAPAIPSRPGPGTLTRADDAPRISNVGTDREGPPGVGFRPSKGDGTERCHRHGSAPASRAGRGQS